VAAFEPFDPGVNDMYGNLRLLGHSPARLYWLPEALAETVGWLAGRHDRPIGDHDGITFLKEGLPW
jgi:hypothetical protein